MVGLRKCLWDTASLLTEFPPSWSAPVMEAVLTSRLIPRTTKNAAERAPWRARRRSPEGTVTNQNAPSWCKKYVFFLIFSPRHPIALFLFISNCICLLVSVGNGSNVCSRKDCWSKRGLPMGISRPKVFGEKRQCGQLFREHPVDYPLGRWLRQSVRNEELLARIMSGSG